MEHLNKRKPNLLFFWFLLPFVHYSGYAVGTLEGTEINISNMRDLLLYSLTHPWPPRFTLLTIKAIMVLLLIWGFAVRIEPEMLLSLDLDELFRDRDKDQTLSAKELEDFLQGKYGKTTSLSEETDAISEDIPITGIERNLQHISLPADQRQSLLQKISIGISDEELMELLQGQGS